LPPNVAVIVGFAPLPVIPGAPAGGAAGAAGPAAGPPPPTVPQFVAPGIGCPWQFSIEAFAALKQPSKLVEDPPPALPPPEFVVVQPPEHVGAIADAAIGPYVGAFEGPHTYHPALGPPRALVRKVPAHWPIDVAIAPVTFSAMLLRIL